MSTSTACDIAVVGLAVLGQNMARTIAQHGFHVAVYNRTPSRTTELVQQRPDSRLAPAYDLPTLVSLLQRPRRVLLTVQAGASVDAMIEQLTSLLDPGDIVIDGTASFFLDTERRAQALDAAGLLFLGVGISQGEEGTPHGPSIMAGGQADAYAAVEPILTAIAGRAADGAPCVAHLGPRGAGHYVKMALSGIEYGDMQLIAEVYDLLARGAGMSAEELAAVFTEWNRGALQSFLVERTADILRTLDLDTGRPLVDMILDTAGQKAAGKWTSQNSFDLGIPVPTINVAVEMRQLSAFKTERVAASQALTRAEPRFRGDRRQLIDLACAALYAAKVCVYAQAMALLRAGSREYHYDLDLASVATVWRAGCTIRARFLDDIVAAFRRNSDLPNLLMDPVLGGVIRERDAPWRETVKTAIDLGIPTPALSSALTYYDAYRSARLPANLIQAQRDLFGAHTYERIDKPGIFHTDHWGANNGRSGV